MKPKDLTHEEVLELVTYFPETGEIYWKFRGIKWFSSGKQTAEHNQAIWNGKFAGKRAFVSKSRGYLTSSIFATTIQAHQLAFFYMKGYWAKEINHIDRNRSNNVWSNLEEVTRSQNSKNRTMQSNNKSGVTGVYWSTRNQLWIAEVMVDQKRVTSKSFDKIEEAEKWIREKYIEFGFSESHGLENPNT